MNGFVGVSKRLLTVDELKQLLQKLSTSSPSCYCLRWPHQVQWSEAKFPDDFPSPEGQMFNAECELRWKQQAGNYSVLLLSIAGAESGFDSVGQNWEVQQRDASIHPPIETRFPKGLPAITVNVAQRYFMDAQTATVRFVALTIAKKP